MVAIVVPFGNPRRWYLEKIVIKLAMQGAREALQVIGVEAPHRKLDEREMRITIARVAIAILEASAMRLRAMPAKEVAS
jgi:hypothetical protein